ncbi:Hypothetical_protein [Hexamita inflata]|uniref:Hypothetical_protein n=1 Tax=Hexamita inflata TaxID=28002 RepID=A0AA86UM01_9EUKA|nr:Hypothetical protein HINF_LOCUS51135 [Hexamita inflata]
MSIKKFNIEQFILTALPTIDSLKYSYFGESKQFDTNIVINMINNLNVNDTHEFWDIMSQIYQCDTKYIQQHYVQITNKLDQGIIWQQYYTKDINTNYSHRHKKSTSEKVLKSQEELKMALISVVTEFGQSVQHSISDKELCVLVNNIVENDATQQFWNRVAAQVRSKTKKQLYDFYHTSFSKALYDSHITKEDKALIEQLNQEQPEKKPAELAQVFLKQTGRNVLKHNVVMCVVYIRRYIQKQKYFIQNNIE